MTLQEMRDRFGEELGGLYPDSEWKTFFYWLLEEQLGVDRFGFSLNSDQRLQSTDRKYFETALDRLKQHEPIQYILGHAWFYGLQIGVNAHTLIPRPETEELVAWVLSDWGTSQTTVLDLGTGSGCIALALAKNMTEATISAMDFSEDALEKAKQNAAELDLQVHFFKGDILEDSSFGQYDVMVSNPPYVRLLEKQMMKQNVLAFEPDSALYVSDDDPLLYYRHLAKLATAMLKPKGAIYVEINEYLGEASMALFEAQGLSSVELRKDLFGKDRMLKAKK